MPTSYAHPSEHVQTLLDSGTSFVLTKKSWDGFSDSNLRGSWQFVVMNCGPKWMQIKAIHNSVRPVSPDERNGRPLWISWKDFGSFGIEVDGIPV
jgi:hypothetical protein